MGIINRIWKRFASWANPVLGVWNLIGSSSYAISKATKLSTVYRCVNLLSDAVASLPLIPYQYRDNWKYVNYTSGLYNTLNVEPNPFVSPFFFKKLIVCDMLLKSAGAAFILIQRSAAGKILTLTRLDPDFVEVRQENGDIYYCYSLNGAKYDRSQVIHILNYTEDGILGKSTLTYAADALGIAYNAESHAGNFFKSGGNMAGILRPKEGVTMNKKQQQDAKSSLQTQLNPELSGNSGTIVVLGDGLEYQSISVNPKDSQLLESRQFNVLEICRFFNVPPSLAYSETGKFSTAEQQSLDFLNNSLTPLLEKIESEFFRKIFLPSEWDGAELKFDVDNILRLDAVAKADYFSKLFNVGGFTTNEIRDKLNASFPVKGGNRAFIPVNLQPSDALISEQTTVNKEAKVDNQVKSEAKPTTDSDTAEDIQKLALNVAQVTSLLEIITNVASGMLPKEAAKAVIKAAFPSFSDEQVNAIVDPIEINKIVNNNE